jgi:hypothetical protein
MKSTKVPKGWEDLFAALTGLTDRFCDEHLDHEYADLARYAIAASDAQGRPSNATVPIGLFAIEVRHRIPTYSKTIPRAVGGWGTAVLKTI